MQFWEKTRLAACAIRPEADAISPLTKYHQMPMNNPTMTQSTLTESTMTQSTTTESTGKSESAESTQLRWDPHGIPPFPAIALQALNLKSGTDASLPALCDLIRSDPAFSTAILRIANSPLVAFPKNVTSVLQAAMLLGFQRLRIVVMTVGLKSYLKDPFTPLMRSCWHHSLACAIIAEQSAKCMAFDNDFAYTAGIMHDIGRVALASLMPGAYARVVKRGADHSLHLLQVEQEFCGIDHCQAGRSLVSTWNLPEAFIAITACHHDPEARLPDPASLIAPSCALADSLGFAVVHCRSPRSYAEILEDFPERVRKRFRADAQELASEIANEIKVIESA